MATWVECKTAVGAGEQIFVNLDLVVSIKKINLGSTITYSSGEFVVKDSPDDILAKQQKTS